MPVLLVLTDFRHGTERYQGFFNLLHSYPHAKVTATTWVLDTNQQPKDIFDQLKAHIDPTDYLYVMRPTPGFVGRGHPGALAWLKNHIKA